MWPGQCVRLDFPVKLESNRAILLNKSLWWRKRCRLSLINYPYTCMQNSSRSKHWAASAASLNCLDNDYNWRQVCCFAIFYLFLFLLYKKKWLPHVTNTGRGKEQEREPGSAAVRQAWCLGLVNTQVENLFAQYVHLGFALPLISFQYRGVKHIDRNKNGEKLAEQARALEQYNDAR